MTELKYWVWLSTRQKLGKNQANDLLRRIGSPEDIFRAEEGQLRKAGISYKPALNSLKDKSLSAAERIIDQCRGKKYSIVTQEDEEYPEKLKNIYDPPLLLYVNGKLPDVDREPSVAMVGTRKAMPYGVREAGRIAGEIASAGGVVITGLAAGIDAASARGALSAGGSVVGVLGCGLDVVYPKGSEELYMKTADSGAVVSEYPPGTRPLPGNFPVRNRIISGLSDGVLIIEAPKRSGSLITANLAIEQGREVFALPGNVDSYNNEGSNRLIKDGIAAVTSGEDIIESLRDRFSGKKPAVRTVLREETPKKSVDSRAETEYIEKTKPLEGLSEDELKVISAISKPNTHVDDIIDVSGVTAAKALSALTMLEIKGYVVRSAGKRFSLNI